MVKKIYKTIGRKESIALIFSVIGFIFTLPALFIFDSMYMEGYKSYQQAKADSGAAFSEGLMRYGDPWQPFEMDEYEVGNRFFSHLLHERMARMIINTLPDSFIVVDFGEDSIGAFPESATGYIAWSNSNGGVNRSLISAIRKNNNDFLYNGRHIVYSKIRFMSEDCIYSGCENYGKQWGWFVVMYDEKDVNDRIYSAANILLSIVLISSMIVSVIIAAIGPKLVRK